MKIGSLVRHKKQGIVGVVTKTLECLEICYVKWSCDVFCVERIQLNHVEVIHE